MKEQIAFKLDQPLLGLMEFCETYCVAGCCGPDAFEINEQRIAEWVARNGISIARQAQEQLQGLMQDITNRDATVNSDRLNAVWSAEACALWLKEWMEVLKLVIGKQE